ncbi:hypothetical protein [Aquimarina sediminis]|uniref:hypothetical protein n=1 Tax=Aquimarina sediminis TaxID=2070536 RepID=UPI000CA05B64|nr:hypothetical protein [Aquimarina sediminis]
MKFEQLLGKPLSVFEKTIGNDFENRLHGKSFYYIPNEHIEKNFFNMTYNIITILKNEKEVVQSISIHFPKTINRKFYDLFVEEYGKPNNIQVIKGQEFVSESHLKDKNGKILQTARKGNFDLVEGTFDEKPLFIIWKKENFYVQAFLRHEQNISEITFSLEGPSSLNVKPN